MKKKMADVSFLPNDMHTLSVIIPCFNSKITLEDSLKTVYEQDLSIPYEIILVDDASTDGTRELINILATKYLNVRSIFHSKNKGGGAARNTGIENSKGDLVYCLDSDNLLTPGSLKKMVEFLDQKGCDGVVFHERRFFAGNNTQKYTAHFNQILNRSIELEDLFTDGKTILDNLLMTKSSFEDAGKFPEHHGFDTQNFEIRYLSAGKKAFICPGTVFNHRQAFKKKSYFERVYEGGFYSLNFYFIYEDIIHLFSSKTLNKIMEYDVFQNTKYGKNNLEIYIRELYNANHSSFFREDYKKLLNPNSMNAFCSTLKPGSTADEFVLGVYCMKKGDYKQAKSYFEKLRTQVPSKLILFNIERINFLINGDVDNSNIVDEIIYKNPTFRPKKQRINLNPNIILKNIIKIKNKIAQYVNSNNK